jgi:ferrochelatase
MTGEMLVSENISRKTGFLLINVGTPDSPQVPDVRNYLKEFLSDPRVIDIAFWARWILLYLFILPFRPKKSAHAYSSIWTPRGSPLLYHGQDLAAGLQKSLGSQSVVELAMRYGNPSIESTLEKFNRLDLDRIVVVPLFPQYSAAATGTALEKVMQFYSKAWNVPSLEFIEPFYDQPGFYKAFAAVAKPYLENFRPDHVLFSYHGLPERHMKKSDTSQTHCFQTETCCDKIDATNRFCYRAQCYATSRSLVSELNLSPGTFSSSFQSRLGRTPWIKPYTDVVLTTLAQKGIRRLAVLCPAFVADCLETLEEIGMRAKHDWVAAGGEDLILVPSLNAHPAWIEGLSQIVTRSAR